MIVYKILIAFIVLMMVLNLIVHQPLLRLMVHGKRVESGNHGMVIKKIASKLRDSFGFFISLFLSMIVSLYAPLFWSSSFTEHMISAGLLIIGTFLLVISFLSIKIRSVSELRIRSKKQTLVLHLIYRKNTLFESYYRLIAIRKSGLEVEYNSPLYREIHLLNKNLKKHKEMVQTLHEIKDVKTKKEWNELLSGQLEALVLTIKNQFEYLLTLESGATSEERVRAQKAQEKQQVEAQKEKVEQEKVEKRLLSYLNEGKVQTEERSTLKPENEFEHESIRDLKVITADDTIPSIYRERAKALLHQIESQKQEKETDEEYKRKIMNVEMVLKAVEQHHQLDVPTT